VGGVPEDGAIMSSGLVCPFDLLLTFKAPDGVPHLHWLSGRHPSSGFEDTAECLGEGLEALLRGLLRHLPPALPHSNASTPTRAPDLWMPLEVLSPHMVASKTGLHLLGGVTKLSWSS